MPAPQSTSSQPFRLRHGNRIGSTENSEDPQETVEPPTLPLALMYLMYLNLGTFSACIVNPLR
jgi:hypothetical protein